MQELLESGLLVVVTILSVVLLLMGQKKSSGMTRKQKVMLWRILIATVLLLGLQTLGVEAFDQLGAAGRWIRLAVHLIDYLIIGYDILKKAFKGICNRQIFDENFLMAVATLGALALAVYENGRVPGGYRRHAVLSGGRVVPELCRWQKPPQLSAI